MMIEGVDSVSTPSTILGFQPASLTFSRDFIQYVPSLGSRYFNQSTVTSAAELKSNSLEF
jgi:hypothetical protein